MHHLYSGSAGNHDTDLPPLTLTSCDPTPDESHDNRSSIFRRTVGKSTNKTDTNNTSPGQKDQEEEMGGGRPSPISIRNTGSQKKDLLQPHPGSIWSPLNDKVAVKILPPAVVVSRISIKVPIYETPITVHRISIYSHVHHFHVRYIIIQILP
jgi:hypothetical protein